MGSDLRMMELAWLAQQSLPVWGGHLERGEPVTDSGMRQMITDGLIRQVDKPCLGYVIGEKGLALLREQQSSH